MDSDQYFEYFEEAASQIDSYENKSSPEPWKCDNNDIIDSDRSASGDFDCNICLDCVQDPVVTFCGHLFCWPCIYKWLKFYSDSNEYGEKQKQQCPVCKSEISQSSLVPLYGRGQTTSASSSKGAGFVVPRRPLGPSPVINSQRSLDTVSHHAPQVYHPNYPNHPQQFNSSRGSYTSSMFNTGGPLTNYTIDPTYQIFGDMIYARVFRNQMTNLYTYPNSYDISGISNPRIRRRLMHADQSLNRISFFLLCCAVVFLLLF